MGRPLRISHSLVGSLDDHSDDSSFPSCVQVVVLVSLAIHVESNVVNPVDSYCVHCCSVAFILNPRSNDSEIALGWLIVPCMSVVPGLTTGTRKASSIV